MTIKKSMINKETNDVNLIRRKKKRMKTLVHANSSGVRVKGIN